MLRIFAPAWLALASPAYASETVPWTSIGDGVAMIDTHNPAGNSVFIGYGGYMVDDSEARAWVDALYAGWLRERGVRYLYAVRGPSDVAYSMHEIGNTRLVADLLPHVNASTQFIAVASHSSGALVAQELLAMLFERGLDPSGATRRRIVYYDLDGSVQGLDDTILGALRRTYIVTAKSDVGDTKSLNEKWMQQAEAEFPSARLIYYDASVSGCSAGAQLCIHTSLINTRPHIPWSADPAQDYVDFVDRPVNAWYLQTTQDALFGSAPAGE